MTPEKIGHNEISFIIIIMIVMIMIIIIIMSSTTAEYRATYNYIPMGYLFHACRMEDHRDESPLLNQLWKIT